MCRNGLIAPDTIVQFKFAHQQRNIGMGIRFEVARDRLAKLQGKLADYLAAVKAYAVPRTSFEPIFRGVLSLRPLRSAQSSNRDSEDWNALEQYVRQLCSRYADELGENAYAVLNAVTDFASHPPDNRHVHRDRHSLQRLAGTWLTSFGQQCCRPDFSLVRYLEEMSATELAAPASAV